MYLTGKNKKKQKRTLNHTVSTNIGNPIKSRNATPANIIHHIDANIALQTLDIFYKKTRCDTIFHNHDCFYINLKYVDILNTCYGLGFYEIVNNDPGRIVKSIFQTNYYNILNNEFNMDHKTMIHLISQIEDLNIKIENIKTNFTFDRKIHEKFWIKYRNYLEIIPNDIKRKEFCELILKNEYGLR